MNVVIKVNDEIKEKIAEIFTLKSKVEDSELRKEMEAEIAFDYKSVIILGLILLVAFGSVVCFAEHLTVVYVGSTALAPRGYVIGIHFGYFPNAVFVVIATHSTQRAV